MKALIAGFLLAGALVGSQPVQAAQTAAYAFDSTGKKIGQVWGEGLGNTTSLALRKLPDGTMVALPISKQGFVDETTTGSIGYMTLWYPTNDCSGPGYITLGNSFDARTGQPLNITPLVQETTDGGAIATYVYNNTLFYAGSPVELTSFSSFASCTDPVSCPNDPLGPCQSLQNPAEYMGGPMTSFDLNSLALKPPFKVQP